MYENCLNQTDKKKKQTSVNIVIMQSISVVVSTIFRKKMETQTSTNERQQEIHRRVQKRIAGKYLDQLDPGSAVLDISLI